MYDQIYKGVWAWAMSAIKYFQEIVRNYAVHLAANYDGRLRLPKRAENPFKLGHHSELEKGSEVDLGTASYYLTIMGVLQWMIEL